MRPVASPSQERLWFEQRLRPDDAALNLPSSMRLRGPLDAAVLSRSLAEIAARHEALRTSFHPGPSGLVCELRDEGLPAIGIEDLQNLPESEREHAARVLARAAHAVPFDLRRPPHLRAKLLRLGPEDQVLVLTRHHVASDGWSLGVVHRELATLYGAFAAGQPSPLGPPRAQMSDFARWHRARLAGSRRAAHVEHWTREIVGMAAAPLFPGVSPTRASAAGRLEWRAEDAVAGRVEATARACRVTPFVVVLAGVVSALGRLIGRDRFLVGTVAARRDVPRFRDVVGPLIETLPLRAEPDRGSARESIARAALTLRGALAHQDLPFQDIVRLSRAAGAPTAAPLVQAMVLYDPRIPQLELPGLRRERFDVGPGATPTPLTLQLQRSHRLGASITWAADVLDQSWAERFAEELTRRLDWLCDR